MTVFDWLHFDLIDLFITIIILKGLKIKKDVDTSFSLCISIIITATITSLLLLSVSTVLVFVELANYVVTQFSPVLPKVCLRKFLGFAGAGFLQRCP